MEVIGLFLAVIGILFAFEAPRQRFLRLVRRDAGSPPTRNELTSEKRSTEDTAVELSVNEAAVLSIAIVRTSTARGQRPKMLVRISDPNGDYRTKWSVTLKGPSGVEYSADAYWPGAGKDFRARFATTEPRTGKWIAVAVRNGNDRHEVETSLPYPDSD